MKTQEEILNKPYVVQDSDISHSFFLNSGTSIFVVLIQGKHSHFYGLAFKFREVNELIEYYSSEYYCIRFYNIPSANWDNSLKFKTEKELLSILGTSGYTYVEIAGNVPFLPLAQKEVNKFSREQPKDKRQFIFKNGKIEQMNF